MVKKTVQIIDGPNLNLTGIREKEIYGEQSFDVFLKETKIEFPDLEIHYMQSNTEGEIIDKLHECGRNSDIRILINPGGYSHTSVAIADAIRAIDNEVIEVHISNIHAREEYRQKMITGSACKGIISGLGLKSYRIALKYFQENKD